MVLTTHAVVGGAIGRLLPLNPILAFVLAFASHFLLDIIPHWDYPLASKANDNVESHTMRLRSGWPLVVDFSRVGFDFLLGALLVYFIFPPGESWWFSSIAWGVFGAVLPDGLQFVYAKWRPKFLRGLQRFHHFIHAKQNLNNRPLLGITLQLALMLVVVVITKLVLSSSWAPIISSLFTTFHLKDALDVFIVAGLIYLALIFIRRTRSFFIINSVIFLFAIYYLSSYFDLTLTRQAFQSIVTFFIVIFVVVFQREIRRFFEWLTSARSWNGTVTLPSDDTLTLLSRSLMELARKKIGALIVIPGEDPVDRWLEGGNVLEGRLSLPILMSIFDPTSPGHDGAVLLLGDRIRRFGVHLPLADNLNASGGFGTRHRAAVGLTERTDALVLVVSEERGTISAVEGGKLKVVNDPAELLNYLKRFIAENIPEDYHQGIWHFLLVKNFWIKLSALLISFVLWFLLVFQIGVVNQPINVPIEFRFLPADLEIVDLNTNTVTVTVSGRNRDLLNFNPEQIKVAVDLTDADTGYHDAVLTPASVVAPGYLSVVKIEPSYINFRLIKSNANN